MGNAYILHIYDTELIRFVMQKRGLVGLIIENVCKGLSLMTVN